MTSTTVSLFCGAGGESVGKHLAFEELGIPAREVTAHAINHWDLAVATHGLNLPAVMVHQEDITRVTARTYGLKHIDLLWASPSCIHHSRARGGKPREEQQRSHAWEVVDRWLRTAVVDVMLVENVPEFMDWGPLGDDGQPIKARKGETFQAFVGDLRSIGYQVEWRVLCAADYGDPTTRRRFFLQAVRDGRPIVWPEATHRDPRKPATLQNRHLPPWRAAAECIDWSLPCPSIFDRKRPLAEATMRRIATGVVRFVLQGKPFLVTCNHADTSFRGQGVDQPISTVTAAHDARGVVVPSMAPFIVNNMTHNTPSSVDEPVRTLTTGNHQGLVAPCLVQTSYGERPGQAPRVLDLHQPLGTVVAGGQKHGLVAAFLARHFGGVVGRDLREPMPTVTAVDHHSVVDAKLGEQATERAREVAAFILKFYGRGTGQTPTEPMHTITTIARLGLVTVEVDGASYVVTDIGLRMLEPRELATAMGFPSWYRWEHADGSALSKRDAIKMIGNACPVNTVKALIKSVVLQRPAQFGLEAA